MPPPLSLLRLGDIKTVAGKTCSVFRLTSITQTIFCLSTYFNDKSLYKYNLGFLHNEQFDAIKLHGTYQFKRKQNLCLNTSNSYQGLTEKVLRNSLNVLSRSLSLYETPHFSVNFCQVSLRMIFIQSSIYTYLRFAECL